MTYRDDLAALRDRLRQLEQEHDDLKKRKVELDGVAERLDVLEEELADARARFDRQRRLPVLESLRIASASHASRGGDPFYGCADIEGEPFLVRERSPFKDELDVDELSKKKWKSYAHECGQALALAHALVDEDSGLTDEDVDRQIADYVENRKLLFRDIWRFTKESRKRVLRDYATFCKEHRLGGFRALG